MKQGLKEECTGALSAQGSLGDGMSKWTTSTPLSTPYPGSEIGTLLSAVSSQQERAGSFFAKAATEPSPSLKTQNEDVIGNPKHYLKGKTQVWDFIVEQGFNYLEGNVCKYLCRYKQKNGLEDLLKAQAYLNKLISEYK